MTTASFDDALSPARKAIRAEILRWNPVMNLVSRQRTPAQLDRLIAQCEAGLGLTLTALASLGIPLTEMGYVDVGSGNGLPGLIWAAGLAAAGGRGPFWLVEPRERRAWFLARLARRDILPEIRVIAGRWGAPLGDGPGPADILISLKALRLTEPAVLGGLATSFAAAESAVRRRVVITRFLGPDPAEDAELIEDLQIRSTSLLARPQACQVLEGPAVRLLVTAHEQG